MLHNVLGSEPREIARHVMRAALRAVDPAIAVKNFFNVHPDIVTQIKGTSGRLFVVGGGKAGVPMVAAVSEIFGDQIFSGRVVVKYGYTTAEVDAAKSRSLPGSPHPPQFQVKISEAGHPIPDKAGLEAASEINRLLNEANEEDTVLCLISGGGSALLTLPAEGLTLADLQSTTESLLAAGATINQFNIIRKHLSKIKGGGLARMAAPATLYALILSDVVADPLAIIASGPTVPDPSTFADAWAIVEQYQLQRKLPEPVLRRLKAGYAGELPDTPKPGDPIFRRVHNTIVGSNRIAARAAVEAARAGGFEALLLTTFVEGEAREVGRVVAGLAKGLATGELPLEHPACLVLGGETTVTLRGDGRGGRNQEMALAAAIALAGWPKVLVACLGTDGSDGPTDAAGAFADGTTVDRARAISLDPVVSLNRNDAYNFFAALDDLILTGPTNTNVNDLTLIFAW